MNPVNAENAELLDALENLATMLRRGVWLAKKLEGDLGIKVWAGKAYQLLCKYDLQGSPLRSDTPRLIDSAETLERENKDLHDEIFRLNEQIDLQNATVLRLKRETDEMSRRAIQAEDKLKFEHYDLRGLASLLNAAITERDVLREAVHAYPNVATEYGAAEVSDTMESNLTTNKARVCISCGQITRNGGWKQTKHGPRWRCALCLEGIRKMKRSKQTCCKHKEG